MRMPSRQGWASRLIWTWSSNQNEIATPRAWDLPDNHHRLGSHDLDTRKQNSKNLCSMLVLRNSYVIFKNFNLFIFGGVNYEPYRAKFENLIGRKVDSIELYPASEGFFAFQDKQAEKNCSAYGFNLSLRRLCRLHSHTDQQRRPMIILEIKTYVRSAPKFSPK